MIRVNAYFDLLGHPRFDVTVSDKNGQNHRTFRDIQQNIRPRNVSQSYWDFIRNAAFLEFARLTNKRGSFRGKRWDVDRGVRHTDVLTAEEIDLIVRGQFNYDLVTNGHCEKLGPAVEEKKAS